MSGVPFVDLKTQYARLKPRIADAIQEVLDDGRYVLGPAVTRFESELADYCGVAHAISCSSGTDAIFMAAPRLWHRPRRRCLRALIHLHGNGRSDPSCRSLAGVHRC